MQIMALSFKDAWIPLIVGLVMGVLAVAFLKYYHVISKFVSVKLKKIPHYVRILAVFALTLVFGLISFNFISTGHEIFELVLHENIAIYMLIILLLVRTTLMLFANTNKLTGGVFVPILAIGAIISSMLGRGIESLFGISGYYSAILALGMSACIASMMKMPLTAVVFSLEALGSANNVLHVIIVVAVSFIITEIFGVKGINDGIVDNLVKSQEETHNRKIIDTHITVQKGSFAEYRHARDILWPANFFLLSIIPSKTRRVQIDDHGSKVFHEGDVLHIRYATFDEEHTKAELTAIVGDQDYDESEAGPE
jgi:H+/Cl- antiporter ClcA